MDNFVKFSYSGRFAHFLMAEANASCPSYRVPPRTVLMGLAGAVLGLEKDQPQVVLKEARIAVSGKVDCTFWHMGNYRKDPPAPLPMTVKANQKGTSAEGRNTRLNQEWIMNPDYTVWMSLPSEFHIQFESRLRESRWHFSPCLGLTEYFANLVYLNSGVLEKLPLARYSVSSVMKRSECEIDFDQAVLAHQLIIQPIMMPMCVDAMRKFQHERYYWEANAGAIPVTTEHAWKANNDVVMWL